jgi:hypothetical protein
MWGMKYEEIIYQIIGCPKKSTTHLEMVFRNGFIKGLWGLR